MTDFEAQQTDSNPANAENNAAGELEYFISGIKLYSEMLILQQGSCGELNIDSIVSLGLLMGGESAIAEKLLLDLNFSIMNESDFETESVLIQFIANIQLFGDMLILQQESDYILGKESLFTLGLKMKDESKKAISALTKVNAVNDKVER